jgi:hypothetical protein
MYFTPARLLSLCRQQSGVSECEQSRHFNNTAPYSAPSGHTTHQTRGDRIRGCGRTQSCRKTAPVASSPSHLIKTSTAVTYLVDVTNPFGRQVPAGSNPAIRSGRQFRQDIQVLHRARVAGIGLRWGRQRQFVDLRRRKTVFNTSTTTH